MKSKGRPQLLTRAKKAQIIEYWVNNPNITMVDLGKKFTINAHTISNIITRDYLSKKLSGSSGLTIITLPSKINEPELITI